MNSLPLSICAFITGICWMASAPIKMTLTDLGYNVMPDDNILVAITAVLFLIVIKRIRFIVNYTDEVLPFYLSILGLILATAGVLVFTRLMLLGLICLVAASYWSKGVVRSYYR